MRIIEAIGRFRAGGYDERLGFTVYDTLRYKQALEPLVAEEVDVLTQRLAGDVDPDRALEIVEAGVGPLNDLMAALHTKLLVAELSAAQAARLTRRLETSRRGRACLIGLARADRGVITGRRGIGRA